MGTCCKENDCFDEYAAIANDIVSRRQRGQPYQVEREAQSLTVEERRRLRNTRARPITDALHRWMLAHRETVPNGSASAKALDYSLKRWAALTRYLDDGGLPIDNNRVENLIRPWALGPSNWLFAGSLRSGQRAANIMSRIQSAKLNGLEPHAYPRKMCWLSCRRTRPARSTNSYLSTGNRATDYSRRIMPVRLRIADLMSKPTSAIERWIDSWTEIALQVLSWHEGLNCLTVYYLKKAGITRPR